MQGMYKSTVCALIVKPNKVKCKRGYNGKPNAHRQLIYGASINYVDRIFRIIDLIPPSIYDTFTT